jgi:ketosteroid isomerase-like protein
VVLEEIVISGDMAVIRGIFTLKFKNNGGTRVENLRFISIWHRQKNGSWLFYCDIWNTYAPSASTQ